jgi:hypothetical protein
MINKIYEIRDPDMAGNTEPNVGNNVTIGPWPGSSLTTTAVSSEEIRIRVNKIDQVFKATKIDQVLEIVIVNMFEDLFDNDFDFQKRHDADKDQAFLIEALRSLLCRHIGLEHPYHALSERYFTADENGDLTFVVDTGSPSTIVKIGIDDNGEPYVDT